MWYKVLLVFIAWCIFIFVSLSSRLPVLACANCPGFLFLWHVVPFGLEACSGVQLSRLQERSEQNRRDGRTRESLRMAECALDFWYPDRSCVFTEGGYSSSRRVKGKHDLTLDIGQCKLQSINAPNMNNWCSSRNVPSCTILTISRAHKVERFN